MIIAVNISQELAKGKTELQATERAWSLDIEKCREHDYVIGVVKGKIKACFKLLNVFPDNELEKKVAFNLEPCSEETDQMIRNYIRDNDINLGGIQRGKYI